MRSDFSLDFSRMLKPVTLISIFPGSFEHFIRVSRNGLEEFHMTIEKGEVRTASMRFSDISIRQYFS
jgi:hypothetical protein